MRMKIARATVNEYKGKDVSLDTLKEVIRIAFAITADKCRWTEKDFQDVLVEVLYLFHEDDTPGYFKQ